MYRTDMSGSTIGRRLGASAGALAAILFLAGFAVPGKPPSPDEPPARIAEYLADHRGAILAGDVLIALASAAFVWFLGYLHAYLRAGSDDRLSIAAALGGATGAGLI